MTTRWNQVARIFESAVSRPPADRAAFLRDAYRDDSDLRQEVESLLAEEHSPALVDVSIGAAAYAVLGDNPAVHPGMDVGPYRIVSPLGVGGMGEVYRARDAKLNREVAIKILPAAFADDADRLARFKREAQVLASLNHPHIGAIYGFEDSGAVHALVLELVEGPTLADRIAKGPLPLDEALPIARQIVDALETAHEQGIVHRDLKPANIKVREDGTVKVLDFGLAKMLEPAGSARGPAVPPTQSPTITTPAMTAAGMILGTAAYMSPEQAKGRPADTRSDIWAFGCVLYEMLTGKRAFDGEDVSETLAAILRSEPDVAQLADKADARLLDLLNRCLKKPTRERWQAIGDLRFELDRIIAHPRSASTSAGDSEVGFRWKTGLGVATALIVGAGVMAGSQWLGRAPIPDKLVTRFSIALPPSSRGPSAMATPFSTSGRSIAISPDGATLAFLADQQIYLRKLSEPESKAVRSVEGATANPVFAPDGQSLAMSIGGSVYRSLTRFSLAGGQPTPILSVNASGRFSWNGDHILFSEFAKGIQRVSAHGGPPELLVAFDGSVNVASPQLLPGGQTVLFSLVGASDVARWDRAQVVVESLQTHQRKILVNGAADAQYVPTGHIVYASGSALVAVPFDARRLEVTGAAVRVVEGVRRATASGIAQYAFSASGTLVYVPGTTTSNGPTLMTLDRQGNASSLKRPSGFYESPRISPDGSQLAYDTDDGKEANVWIYHLGGETEPRKLTTAGGRNRFPIWSSDSQHVVFQSNREGDLAIYWQRADGRGPAERLTHPEPGTVHMPDAWIPQQQAFSFSTMAGAVGTLWTYSFNTRQATPFPRVRSTNPLQSSISRDGQWIAYGVRRAGSAWVFVEPLPPTGDKYEVPVQGAHHPLWSPDGTELFFFPSASPLTSIKVRTKPTFEFGPPTVVPGAFSANVSPTSARNHDITPDGQRFITVDEGDLERGRNLPQTINVVLNWFEELRRLAPASSSKP